MNMPDTGQVRIRRETAAAGRHNPSYKPPALASGGIGWSTAREVPDAS
ncbi:hypothetical protein LG293_07120 [Citricoccus nitrophenolicus]